MRPEQILALEASEDEEELRDLAEAKILTAWQEIEFFKRCTKLPTDTRDATTLWALYSSVAAIAVSLGVDSADFAEAMSKAYAEAQTEAGPEEPGTDEEE
jgi:hypothetical protein